MRKWPAVDVRSGPADVIPAIVDDFGPTAIEERADAIRVFFTEPHLRDAAGAALSAANYSVQPVDVDDEDWARRSQENLKPVTVGRITVAPPAEDVAQVFRLAPAAARAGLKSCATIVIRASMGFGTGHHATTRLCLRALQTVDLANRCVLDVGTGSGVLAIAAVRLGAARAVGIDYDPDAIQAANENLGLNPGVETVEFRVADLLTGGLPAVDIVTANLTGAFLVRRAGLLLDLLRPAGTLIVSGLLEEERDDVVRAFAGPDKVRPTPETGRTRPEVGRTPSGVGRTPSEVGRTPLEVGRTRPEVGRTLSGPPSEVGRTPSEVGRTLSGPPMTLVWEHHEDGWVALAMKRS